MQRTQSQKSVDTIGEAQKMLSAYLPRYLPDPSSFELLKSERFDELSKLVTVYYSGDRHQAEYLATQRDPTNFENKAHYNPDSELEWGCSGFNVAFDYNPAVLPTNIGIACKTPVIGTSKEVLFMNSIGFALDNRKQPHYRYYSQNQWKNIVEDFAVNFDMLFRCAKDYGKRKIVLCYLGGGWFSDLYPEDYLSTLYLPALELAMSRASPGLTHIGIMGNVAFNVAKGVKQIMDKYSIEFESFGYVPGILTDEDTVYQNAWDPHAMIGNGNKSDNSLDGFVGRSTNMHFLCWPLTNPNMKYTEV